ncbi:hypothetical protein ACFQ1B_20710 [Streptomyces mexicanus]
MLQTAEFADDRRHRRAHDHVVEHREHHRDHEGEQHDPHALGLFAGRTGFRLGYDCLRHPRDSPRL